MRQKTLHEFSSDGFQCPQCGSSTETVRGLASHWEQSHDSPRPDWIEYTVSEEHREKISGSLSGRELTEEHKQNIADGFDPDGEYREKMSKSLAGREVTDDHRRKISESMSGENNPNYGACGEAHPNYGVTWSEEVREKISDSREGNNGNGGVARETVPETGHTVKSSWEAEIDRTLHKTGADFGYEPRTFTFEDGRQYTPDFIANGKVAVEVKGYVWEDWNVERAELFMSQFSDYTYIVVGASLPCDHHLSWEQREGLTELI